MDRTESRKDSIASVIYDNRRRGEPLPGCDCFTCFGYCLIDRDTERRDMLRFQEELTRVPDFTGDAA